MSQPSSFRAFPPGLKFGCSAMVVALRCIDHIDKKNVWAAQTADLHRHLKRIAQISPRDPVICGPILLALLQAGGYQVSS